VHSTSGSGTGGRPGRCSLSWQTRGWSDVVCNDGTPRPGLPRAQEKNENGDNSRSWVLAGDTSGGGWRRRRRVSPAVELVVVAPTAGVLMARWLETLEKKRGCRKV